MEGEEKVKINKLEIFEALKQLSNEYIIFF